MGAYGFDIIERGACLIIFEERSLLIVVWFLFFYKLGLNLFFSNNSGSGSTLKVGWFCATAITAVSIKFEPRGLVHVG